MAYQIENMRKTEFDGFIEMLDAINFAFPLDDTEEGRKSARQYSLVTRLRENTDFEVVYRAYDRYVGVKSFPAWEKEYKKELDELRAQCANS